MPNNRITPFVKRMRTTGGTIYTFSSAVEDIGLNINERNNVVKISHFALLNIPKINEPDNIPENRFNVLAIPSAFEYWKTQGSIKDGRVIVGESFQNYALNFESNLLNQDSYDSTLSKTVSERVFWKWMKETGAIRWANPSNGYWMEAEDSDGSLGYNTVVKYFGLVSAGNVRSDSFGTYNETYVLVPTSHGQMEPYYEQVLDNNYKPGIVIGNLGENILGREGWTKPHPDALSFLGYYDYVDSSTKVWNSGPYNMSVNGVPGGWYSAEGINPIPGIENYYFTDAPIVLSGDYDASIRYDNGGDVVEFKRSKLDCVSLVLDLNKLKGIYGNDPDIRSFDDLATGNYAVNDTFEFNAVMIYYSIYNSVQDTILATNLLGILFLDAPSGNTQVIGNGAPGILLPSLEKIQSGPSGFGTSYALRLNIKSDNMVDDTAATIVDYATSDQLQAENWNEAFFELEKAVNILTQNNSVLNYISDQYLQVQNVQTQMANELQQLEYTVSDIGKEIKGTAGALTMFSDGSDPLIESSIFMASGNIGFFNPQPTWPVQIDASLKTKDIYIENAIRDISGNILLGYGSPQQFGSPTNFRGMAFYTGNPTPAISIDISNNVILNNLPINTYINESSLGTSFLWNAGILDVSATGGGGISFSQMTGYVDPSLNVRDLVIENTRAAYIPNASLGTGFAWIGPLLTVNVSTGGGGVSQAYVDGSLATRDFEIAGKQPAGSYATNSFVTTSLYPYATNASIGIAGFAKTANSVQKSGDSMSGPLTLYDDLISNGSTIHFNGAHIEVTGPLTDVTCPAVSGDLITATFTPKGSHILITFCATFYTSSTGAAFNMNIYIDGVGNIHNLKHTVYSGWNTVTISSLQAVTPGVSKTVRIKWYGSTAIHQKASTELTPRKLSIVDLF
jgi:hypothetical protein